MDRQQHDRKEARTGNSRLAQLNNLLHSDQENAVNQRLISFCNRWKEIPVLPSIMMLAAAKIIIAICDNLPFNRKK